LKIRFSWIEDKKSYVYGECFGDEIVINPYDAVVATLIHEMIHWKHPEINERSTVRLEENIHAQLTMRQKKHLINLLLKKVGENGGKK